MITKDTTILVLGCGGMLGEAVYNVFKDRCNLITTDIDLNEPWLTYLDMRDKQAVDEAIDRLKPHYVFHLGALTDVEYCELHPEEAYMTNALATENTALACARHDIPMIYIGTAGIFDGAQEYYNDYDKPNPLSVYGKAKYAGEIAVQTFAKKHFIFRAGWMMGGGPKKDKKFVQKFLRQIRQGKTELSAVDDKLGSPTYTYDFANSILTVVNAGIYGLYHSVGLGDCSRYDVAVELLKLTGQDKRCTVKKVDSSVWAKEYFAPRPRSEKLINLKLNLRKMNVMRHWTETLREYTASHEWGLPH